MVTRASAILLFLAAAAASVTMNTAGHAKSTAGTAAAGNIAADGATEAFRNTGPDGYAAESMTADIADTTIFDTLDEVVVTGSNNAVSRNLLPYTVSTVNSS